jgi:hypothetical protein
LAIGDLRFTIGDWRLAIGDLRLAICDLRLAIGGKNAVPDYCVRDAAKM